MAVLEATQTEDVVLISLSQGASRSLQLAADHPDRVLGQVFLGPTLPLTPPPPERAHVPETFAQAIADPEGWEKYNEHYWQTDYRDFAEFFFAQALPEPHSTKQREDCVGWAMETTPDVLVAESRTKTELDDRDQILELCARVQSPTLVIHGTDDRISPFSRGVALAEATRGRLIAIEGGGHMPQGRDPVIVNLAIRAFVEGLAA
jgi:pimeloyl-ACP methyl ester carboxylesterase